MPRVNENHADEIAVISINGRFPQARNTKELWRNLLDGVEAISFFTDEELTASGIDAVLVEQPNYIKARAVIEDYDLIDAAFFGLNPREAEIIDPQHRLFMECAWEALELAGYNPDAYDGSIGVYCGASSNTYLLFNLLSNREAIASVGAFQTAISSALDFIATRVSYKFNLRGPSLTVQTACSTSLVAVHLACQSLLNGECDMALAGGVAINVPQKSGYTFEAGGILSPDGHCRPFDAKAQGTVPGSGAAIVLLKRMEDALADNDHIHAVIKGSAINNDGSQKIGYTAPSVDGQVRVIADALSVAGVSPETVTYIEAHGTGTTLGDPIEVEALSQVFCASTDKRGYCAIGSIKSNIGHLDAAAGATGLIKVVLALEHKMLPPSLHYEEANPQIDFPDSPFYVNSGLAEWKHDASPRRASVSSFGIGGTNAHVVLEEAPEVEASGPHLSAQLLVLSAKTSSALEKATENLAAHLRGHPKLNLADVAYTLQVGRKAFEHRRILVAQTCEDASATLVSPDTARVLTDHQELRGRAVTFMFPGQGAQYVHMARGLYEEAVTFRHQLDLCADILKPHLGFDLRRVIYPDEHAHHRWIDPFETSDFERQDGTFEEAAARHLQQTFITQPALFIIEFALAKQLMEWGIEPKAMIGHSIGQYVAACLAGVFELRDALALVAARGKLMQSLPAGSMLAVNLAEEEVQPLLGQHLSLASVNSRSLCVVAGANQAVDVLQQRLTAQGVTSTCLHTSHAFHSQMMDSILERFVEQVRRVKLNPPQLPFISNLTGTWITEAEATDPDYWGRHLRHTVRFADGLQELLKNPGQVLLEVGPGQTLSSLAKHHAEKKPEQIVLNSLRHPREQQPDLPFLLGILGQLWLSGVEVEWPGLYAHQRRRRVLLPTYAFERQRYWIDAQPQGSAPRVAGPKQSVADYFYIPVWKQSPMLPGGQTGAALDENSCWLIFLDDAGLGAQIEARLERDGQRVVTVARGEGWKVEGENSYTINPRQRQNFDALMKDLKKRNLAPARILHLWNVSSEDDALPQVAPPDASLADDSFYGLLFVAQSLGAQNFAGQISIAVVSNNMQTVTGDERLRPEKATLLGPCRVIPQEYANLTCRSLDIVSYPRANSERDSLIDRLLAEFYAAPAQAICAYRGRQRWVQTFDEIHLDEQTTRPSLLKNGGVYLITGAQTQTGLVFAEYLAESVRAQLVLVVPSQYPERNQWKTWLAANEGEGETRRLIETVRKLEASGVETLVINANTSDQAQMKAAVAQSIQAFGMLNGVLHTESVAGGGLVQLKTAELAGGVFKPKVHATLSLDDALGDLELDFFALFASSTALTGGIGQVDYCAANAFLDAFAHYRASRCKGLTVSIDWDPFKWEDWQGAQMSGAPDVQAQVKETLETFGLTEQESAEAFSRTLSSGLSQLIVSKRDFRSILEQYRTLTVSTLMAQMGQSRPGGATHARPALSTPYVAPRNETERAIAEIWQELFGLEEIGVHDKFFELGGSSLLAIQLITRLRNSFGEDVSMNSIFEQPTVAGLAEVVGGSQLKQNELEEVERVYAELKDLSPEELQALLADDLGFASGEDINA